MDDFYDEDMVAELQKVYKNLEQDIIWDILAASEFDVDVATPQLQEANKIFEKEKDKDPPKPPPKPKEPAKPKPKEPVKPKPKEPAKPNGAQQNAVVENFPAPRIRTCTLLKIMKIPVLSHSLVAGLGVKRKILQPKKPKPNHEKRKREVPNSLPHLFPSIFMTLSDPDNALKNLKFSLKSYEWSSKEHFEYIKRQSNLFLANCLTDIYHHPFPSSLNVYQNTPLQLFQFRGDDILLHCNKKKSLHDIRMILCEYLQQLRVKTQKTDDGAREINEIRYEYPLFSFQKAEMIFFFFLLAKEEELKRKQIDFDCLHFLESNPSLIFFRAYMLLFAHLPEIYDRIDYYTKKNTEQWSNSQSPDSPLGILHVFLESFTGTADEVRFWKRVNPNNPPPGVNYSQYGPRDSKNIIAKAYDDVGNIGFEEIFPVPVASHWSVSQSFVNHRKDVTMYESGGKYFVEVSDMKDVNTVIHGDSANYYASEMNKTVREVLQEIHKYVLQSMANSIGNHIFHIILEEGLSNIGLLETDLLLFDTRERAESLVDSVVENILNSKTYNISNLNNVHKNTYCMEGKLNPDNSSSLAGSFPKEKPVRRRIVIPKKKWNEDTKKYEYTNEQLLDLGTHVLEPFFLKCCRKASVRKSKQGGAAVKFDEVQKYVTIEEFVNMILTTFVKDPLNEEQRREYHEKKDYLKTMGIEMGEVVFNKNQIKVDTQFDPDRSSMMVDMISGKCDQDIIDKNICEKENIRVIDISQKKSDMKKGDGCAEQTEGNLTSTFSAKEKAWKTRKHKV